MKNLAAVAMAIVLALALGGCGYKGPLYLPKPTPDGRAAPAIVLPEPAPDRPIPSQSAPPPK